MPAPEAGEPATDAVLDLGVADALAARRSCRSFLERPLEQGLLADLIDRARRTPSAGNAQGVDFLLLEGPADTAAYWETTLPEEGRAAFPWPGLLAAPALVVVYADADRYVERYAEADKAASGLGGDAGDWPVPVPVADLGEGSHLSYAVQWFVFTAIGLVGYPLVLVRLARRGDGTVPVPDESAPAPVDDPR